MRFTIIGAGGIGGVIGAHLAMHGHQVTFVESRREHVEAVLSRGLTVSGIVSLTVRPSILLPGNLTGVVDTVLLSVKAQDTQAALAAVLPHLSARSCVVSLQNGLEVERVASAVGASRTLGAEITFGAYYSDPGHVVYTGRGDLSIGELNGAITARIEELQHAFTSLLPTKASPNILGMIWSKVALGSMWFATALVDEDVPVIFQRLEYRPLFRHLAAEVVQVAKLSGVSCEPITGIDMTAFVDRNASADTIARCWQALVQSWSQYESKRTGVWRDIAVRHRPTEVASILGPVVERGVAERVGTPLLEKLAVAISELENGSRQFGWHNLEDLTKYFISLDRTRGVVR